MKKSTIVIITNGSSCTNASFTLARSLQENGHHIIYIDLNNKAAYLEQQGYEVLSINVPAIIHNEYSKPIRSIFFRRFRMRVRAYMRLQEFTNFHSEQWLQQNRPALVLLDSNLPGFAVPLLKLHIPIVNISSTLSSLNPDGAPPVFSNLFPGNRSNPFSGLQIRISWMILFMVQRVKDTLEKIFIRIESKGQQRPVREQISMYGGMMKRTEYGLRLIAPEIILNSKCIDFPGKKKGIYKLYSGACVYEDRKEEAVNFENPDPQKPIIYCSLGTCSDTYAYKEHFYSCLMETMETLQQYQLVLQIDDPWPAGKKIPDNVTIYRRVPQLAVLRLAKVFITHGGASSIREGIYYGVPMIVFPGWHDQFGNAARVAYYGIGLRGSMRNITTPKFLSMLTTILTGDRFSHAIREMQQDVLKKEEITTCTEFIERLLKTENSIGQHIKPDLIEK